MSLALRFWRLDLRYAHLDLKPSLVMYLGASRRVASSPLAHLTRQIVISVCFILLWSDTWSSLTSLFRWKEETAATACHVGTHVTLVLTCRPMLSTMYSTPRGLRSIQSFSD